MLMGLIISLFALGNQTTKAAEPEQGLKISRDYQSLGQARSGFGDSLPRMEEAEDLESNPWAICHTVSPVWLLFPAGSSRQRFILKLQNNGKTGTLAFEEKQGTKLRKVAFIKLSREVDSAGDVKDTQGIAATRRSSGTLRQMLWLVGNWVPKQRFPDRVQKIFERKEPYACYSALAGPEVSGDIDYGVMVSFVNLQGLGMEPHAISVGVVPDDLKWIGYYEFWPSDRPLWPLIREPYPVTQLEADWFETHRPRVRGVRQLDSGAS